MSIGTQACDIMLPGYLLSERIGSGGYAEVWRAEAPGGIEKAVKIVYGYYNDEFASQELKALERIKGVRHPFLLSLERFEVINGRLAIITELADMSLDQRLTQCHAEGLTGIPREELLRYVADAAEALDFLFQKHSLLHLDIKPENLLISGNHVKVADFGLVKELATRTQNSLVSGMTPTYAAPEMFDDDPSGSSDQYSLAIVYQQMLSGTLPFPGRTAAQLAKQHTLAEPQLNPLPEGDRHAVARALAKKPEDRFPSCKAFVDALLNRVEVAPAAPAKPARPPMAPAQPTTPDPGDTKPSSICKTIPRGPKEQPAQVEPLCTQPVKRAAASPTQQQAKAVVEVLPFIDGESVDIAVPAIDALLRREQPTLYIAVGGVGIQLLSQLRSITAPQGESDAADRAVEAIALDTDREELRVACSNRQKVPLSPDDALHVPLRLPKSYDDSPDIHGWVSRRWLYNIPRSLETRGYRPLGRVALVDHCRRVSALIDQKLQRLATFAGSTGEAGEARDQKIKVMVLSGTGGGTGAGMAIDIANAAKSLAAERELAVETNGFFVCTCFASNNTSPLVAANAYSLLTELSHVSAHGNVSNGQATAQNGLFESSAAPFDYVYWMPAHTRTAESNSIGALDPVARYLTLDAVPDVRATLRSCRASQTPREQSANRALTLKHAGCASLADQRHQYLGELAEDLANEVKRFWFTNDTSVDWARLVNEEQQRLSAPPPQSGKGQSSAPKPASTPANGVEPLALRARFKEHVSLEFTSEVLLEIQLRLEAHDDRGRPAIVASDARVIADTARNVIASLAARYQPSGHPSAFASVPVLQPLIAECSRQILSSRIEKFDFKQPDTFLPDGKLDELLKLECQTVLQQSVTRPDLAAAITDLIDLPQATELMLEQATTDRPRCGSDQRTILFVPSGKPQNEAADKLHSAKPLAAVVPAAVDDMIVVSEEAGISPRALAQGIESMFPGVADAARRLHTRVDVDWQSL